MAGPANQNNQNNAIGSAASDLRQAKQTVNTARQVVDVAKELKNLKAAGALAKGAVLGPAGIAAAVLQSKTGKKICIATVAIVVLFLLFIVGSLSIITNKMFKVNPWQSEAGAINATANIDSIQINQDEVSDINTAIEQLNALQEYFISRYGDEQNRILEDLEAKCNEATTATAVYDYNESLKNALGLEPQANVSREDALYYAAAVSVALGQLTNIETNEDGSHVPADYEADHLSAKWMDKHLDLSNTYTWSFGAPVLFKTVIKTEETEGAQSTQTKRRDQMQSTELPVTQADKATAADTNLTAPKPGKQTIINFYYIPLLVSHQEVYQTIADSLGIDLDQPLPNSTVTVFEQIDEVMRMNACLVAPDLATDVPTYAGDMSGIVIDGGKTNVVYFCQRDARWKNILYGSNTIGRSGCGPTSASIIISTLTGQTVAPPEICSWSVQHRYRVNGSGTAYGLFAAVGAAYGLKVEGIGNDAQKLVKALENGKLAVGIFRPGTFSSSGHFVVLRGVTADGDILVADPNKAENNSLAFPLRTIMGWLRGGVGAGGPIWVFSN